MPDAAYDAIVIGAGAKGLITAMYLAKYGQMDVALFERRHEAGGGLCTEEASAPGFLCDIHATGIGGFHFIPVDRDFPEFTELVKRIVTFGFGVIFQDDDSCFVGYNRTVDPTRERIYAEIAKFSERDAEAFLKLEQKARTSFFRAMLEFIHNPPTPVGEPDALERLSLNPDSGFDPSWAHKSTFEIARDVFESNELITPICRLGQAFTIPPEVPGMPGFLGFLMGFAMLSPRGVGVVGGSHNVAHAAIKIILRNGGKFWTKCEVDKVLIENGAAKGIRLIDGTEVEARKLVLSTLDPYTLCFRLIGEEHLNNQILRRVKNLERRKTILGWYNWALHEHPNYTSSRINPDINKVGNVLITRKDPEILLHEIYGNLMGRWPEVLSLNVINHSLRDKTRVPEGKAAIITEQFIPPGTAYSEDKWLELRKMHAEQVINLLQKHTTNVSWDNVIGYFPDTPDDYRYRLPNMGLEGNESIIDTIPSQFGRCRPIPELSGYRTPIKNLYATGGAWPPMAGTWCPNAYNAYKVIAEDLGLEKPWAKEDRPW